MSTLAAEAESDSQLEQFRPTLTGYCYRMLGSAFEADDAVQETMVRAWRGLARFEARSALQTWLHRIATNVCLDMLNGKQRRVLPVDLGPATPSPSEPGRALPNETWLDPIPDSRVLIRESDPAETAVRRETIRLAFVAALQLLPPRQRVVLILRDVLRWKAEEVADALNTSVAAANSALQRARGALAAHSAEIDGDTESTDQDDQGFLAAYVNTFERFDIESLVTLLHMDATLSMPPHELWLRGSGEISRWLLGPGRGCAGSRLLPVEANGMPAFAQYRPDPEGGHKAWALQVLEVSNGRLLGLNSFLDTERLFPLFGLPARLED